MNRIIILPVGALALAFIGLLILDRELDDYPASHPYIAEKANEAPATAPSSVPLSPMAKALLVEDGSTAGDLRALGDIFRYYTLEPSGQIPTGTNQEITRALTQKGDTGVPYIPANHPSINSKGELVDRWETPYFFHALSSQQMEIRSAGPDQRMYTDDDMVWPEPVGQHQRRSSQNYVDLGL